MVESVRAIQNQIGEVVRVLAFEVGQFRGMIDALQSVEDDLQAVTLLRQIV